MAKVVFVILHYLGIEDTLECINSIQENIEYNNYEVVIVDNASSNGSGKKLESIFDGQRNIYILQNNQNEGFAKGNNLGYKFAKETLSADFIIVINNDTLILDKDFISKVVSYYNQNKYYILGPRIISTKDNLNQNPLSNIMRTKKDVIYNIIKYRLLYILNIIKVEGIYKTLKPKLRKEVTESLSKDNENCIENIPLHGACLIFSPLFLEKNNNAFYPHTFLFVEEDILYYMYVKNNYKLIYYPFATIYHKEDSSTDLLLNTPNKKRKFIYKNIEKSSRIFLKLMLFKERED